MPERAVTNDTARLAVKVFGERNCGTNFTETVLKSSPHLRVLPQAAPKNVRGVAARLGRLKEPVLDLWDSANRRRTMGWKHCYIDDTTVARMQHRPVVGIALTKHPLSWLVSLRKNPYHILRTGSSLTHQHLIRERLPRSPRNLFDLWQIKTERYLRLRASGDLMVVRFEDVVVAPADVLTDVFESRAVEVGDLVVPERSVKARKDSRSTGQIQSEYAAEKWRDALTEADYEEAHATLSPALLRELSYEI